MAFWDRCLPKEGKCLTIFRIVPYVLMSGGPSLMMMLVISDVDVKSRIYFDKLVWGYSTVWARTSQSSAYWRSVMRVDISFIWTLRILRLKRLPKFRCIICNIICHINMTTNKECMRRDETIAYTGNEQQRHKLWPVGNLRKWVGQGGFRRQISKTHEDAHVGILQDNFYTKFGSWNHA